MQSFARLGTGIIGTAQRRLISSISPIITSLVSLSLFRSWRQKLSHARPLSYFHTLTSGNLPHKPSPATYACSRTESTITAIKHTPNQLELLRAGMCRFMQTEDFIAHASKVLHQVEAAEKPTAALVYTNRDESDVLPSYGTARHVLDCRKKRVGILSASFNPFTLAHKHMVTLAREKNNLEGIVLLLTVINVDKQNFGATLPQRLAMLKAFLDSSEASSWGPTDIVICSHPRFVDAAIALDGLYQHSQYQSVFLLGFDTLVRLFDPKYYDDMTSSLKIFFDLAEIIAYNRDDVSEDVVKQFIHESSVGFENHIHVLNIQDKKLQFTSSSDVRRRVVQLKRKSMAISNEKANEKANDNENNYVDNDRLSLAVPAAVDEFIAKFQLYQS